MKNKFVFGILVLVVLTGFPAHVLSETAVEPVVYKVKDISPQRDGSLPSRLTLFNGVAFFTANDQVHGFELWTSDGTSVGTQIFLDLVPGTDSSNATPFAVMGNNLLFVTSSPSDAGLWKTDGTIAGTELVKDFSPEYFYSAGFYQNDFFAVLNNVLYFVVADGVYSYDLWRSDGTTAGTYMVKDIEKQSTNAMLPEHFYVFDNRLYFSAPQGSIDAELWMSDGTEAGTVMVKNIHPDTGIPPTQPRPFFGLNEWLYFGADDGIHGYELWKTNGAETVLVKDINPGLADSFPGVFVEYNGKFYFDAQHASYGCEPWVTDGTTDGTILLKDIFPQGVDLYGSSYPGPWRVFKGQLYFAARSDPAQGTELWKTDGTPAGTAPIKVISTAQPRSIVVFGDKLYFGANWETGLRLWSSDGSPEGTASVPGEYGSDPDELLVLDNVLLFRADDGSGAELWAYGNRLQDLSLYGHVTPTYGYETNTAITYTLTFSNVGDVVMTGVAITDVIPGPITIQQVVHSGTAITQTGVLPYTWAVADLAPGEGGIITITGRLSETIIMPTPAIISVATINSDLEDTVLQNNTATIILNPHRVFLPLTLRE